LFLFIGTYSLAIQAQRCHIVLMTDAASEVVLKQQVPEHEVTKPNIIFEIIKKVNSNNKEWQENRALQERQQKITAKLSEKFPTRESLVDYLANYCLTRQREHVQFAKKKHFSAKKLSASTVAVGELFEKLVGAENDVFDIYSEINGIAKQEKSEEQRHREIVFIDVLTHPERHGFPTIEYFNIPDIPFIVTWQRDHLALKAVAEVKSGKHLDARAYQQLLPFGIRNSIKITLERLNSLKPEDARRRGLDGFGVGKEMYMLKNFDHLVVLCRDMNTDDKEELIERKGFSDPEEFYEFKKMLEGRHRESKVTLVKSSISRDELTAIFSSIVSDIVKKYKETSPQIR